MLTPDAADAEQVSPSKYGVIPVGGPVAGPAHDRVLGTTIGLLLAVTVSRHLIGHGGDATSVYAIGMYVGAALVGYGIGQKVPAEHRAALQVAAGTALTMVGMGSGFGGAGGGFAP